MPRSSRNRHAQRRCLLETLEKRELMATDITANLDKTGTLIVWGGGAQDDNIVIDYQVGKLVVRDGRTNEAVAIKIDLPNGTVVQRYTIDRSSVTGGRVVIATGDGNNVLNVRETRDTPALPMTVFAGAGDDILNGGSADDIMYGRDGNDVLTGNGGNDMLYGGWGMEWETAPSRGDKLYGNAGNDLLMGSKGNDLLDGGDGNDFLRGWLGNDQLTGGAGSNEIEGNDGNDTIVEQLQATQNSLTNSQLQADQNRTALSGIENAKFVQANTAALLQAQNYSGLIQITNTAGQDITKEQMWSGLAFLNPLSLPKPTSEIAQPILDLYNGEKGLGLKGLLGKQIGPVIHSNGGQYVIYENGRIYWSQATGACALYGAVLKKYLDMKGELGVLGFPKTSLTTPLGGASVAAYAYFEKGFITIRNKSVWVIQGEAYTKWKTEGGIGGYLGYPKGDEFNTGNGSRRMQLFDKGAVFIDQQGKTTALLDFGPNANFFTKWLTLIDVLGFPIGTSAGGPNGGAFSWFERGALFWSPATGMHIMKGLILERYWNSEGGPWGHLGYPTSDEIQTTDGWYYSMFAKGEIDLNARDGNLFYVWEIDGKHVTRTARPENPYSELFSRLSYVVFEMNLQKKPISRR